MVTLSGSSADVIGLSNQACLIEQVIFATVVAPATSKSFAFFEKTEKISFQMLKVKRHNYK